MNFRTVLAGVLMVVLAIGFFLYMAPLAPKSNDPAELMRVVGMVSGGVGALGLVVIVLGLLGKGFAKRG